MSVDKDKSDAMGRYKKQFHELKSRLAAQCPSSDKLVSYANDELDESAVQALQNHLDLCPVCLQAVQALQNADAATESSTVPNWPDVEAEMDAKVYAHLETLSTGKTAIDKAKPEMGILSRLKSLLRGLFPPAAPLYAAAAFALLMVSVYGYAFFSRPATFAMAQIQLPPTTQLRGGTEQIGMFQEGMTRFRKQDFQLAIENFTAFLEENPNDYSANFYLGLSYLATAKIRLLGMPYRFDAQKVEKGAEYLRKALDLSAENPFYTEDCLWYLSKARLMLNDVRAARRLLQQLVALPHPGLTRREAAKRVLGTLNHLPESQE